MVTPEQAGAIAEGHPSVSVFESRMNKVHTTRSWEFLGVEATSEIRQQQIMKQQSNVIVGVIDSGTC